MATQLARNDALIVQQISTLTPVVANGSTYGLKINSKATALYTSDASATAQEIVEGVQAILTALTAAAFAEASEVTWTENDVIVTATGPTTGKPFTLVTNGASALTVATPTTAKGPNHWIAENFSAGTLPANNDTVIISQLSQAQSFWWNLDQNAVSLTLLDIRADSQAHIGLPNNNNDTGVEYYQGNYRDLFLKISCQNLKIGDGKGQGSGRIRINLGAAVDCEATIYGTGSPADSDEGAVQLLGGTASSAIQIMGGKVDLAMFPGSTGSWGTIVASAGQVRCGTGCTLATVTVSTGATIETRTAVVTLNVGINATCRHIGGGIGVTTGNITGKLEVQATAILTITTLNGFGGGSLDLSKCDSLVTVTDMNIYATPTNPFTINDPNSKLVMTNPAVCKNGVQSLQISTGANKNLRVS